MAKRKTRLVRLDNRTLGILILVGLIIEFVLPRAGITFFDPVAIFLYLFVGVYLLLF